MQLRNLVGSLGSYLFPSLMLVLILQRKSILFQLMLLKNKLKYQSNTNIDLIKFVGPCTNNIN